MQDLLLQDYKPRTTLVTEDYTPRRARFPVVDAHNHLGLWDVSLPHYAGLAPETWLMKDVPWMVDMMDELNVRCIVDLDGGWGEIMRLNLDRYKAHYPDRFAIFAWVDWPDCDDPQFGDKWGRELESLVAEGAQGLKVYKDLGLVHRDRRGKLIMPDDPRLDPIWAKAGELKIPVLIHSADPVAFFEPLGRYNERYEELHAQPDWHFYGKDYPTFMALIESQLRVVERHPGTTFISAHVLSYAENLRYVSQALDRYPNLYVDISARIGELGRQPYSARRFLIDYADRVVFGTDQAPNQKLHYELYYRFLETHDEYFEYGRNQGRWRIYGVHLPDEVLRKIYSETACRLIPGLSC